MITDKLDPVTKRNKGITCMRLGQVKFNDHIKPGCKSSVSMPFIQEMQKFQYKDGRQDSVTGKDHWDASYRYYMAADYKYDDFAAKVPQLKKYGTETGEAVY